MSVQTGYIDGKQTTTYRIWAGMKNRCLNPKNKDYARYGGRGIAVCNRWHYFAHFLVDMGERPPGLTIDRRDNNGPYSLDNCRWATRKQQRENMPSFRGLNYETLGVKSNAVSQRIRRGWPVDQAMKAGRSNRWTGRPVT